MKRNFCRFMLAILAAALLALTACENDIAVEGISLPDFAMTLYSSQRLEPDFRPSNASNKKVTWISSNPDVVSVSENGTVKALTITDTATGTGQAVLTATSADGGFTANCVVNVTMDPLEDAVSLIPLKDSFKDYFMIGNVINPRDMDEALINKDYITHHYSVLTCENNMKPVFLCGTEPGAYNADNIALAKRMIDAAKAKGIKFHGHCLMWHGQIAPWQSAAYFGSLSNEEVLTLLREYITDIVTEFKGRVHSWDVLNEAFNDGGSGDWRTAIRTANPWYSKLGADFVYEGFVAARKADPDALLYYNDYNLDNIGKATMVYNMTRDLNLRYSVEHPEDGRHLIDGIGMQGHENSGVPAANVRAGIALFRQLGVLISISEFDVLAHTYSDYEQSRPVTIQNRLNQANQFRDYFKVFLDNADIIERITFWGNSDVNSWRARSEPLPFTTVEGILKAKPAFYRMVESLDME